ncbi:MAG TPA: hypothetical protein VJ861_02080 [Treponemataceae bacterium]|jgi:hypothetical protein|nr:hypothetical protein [Treponemataceae bacterium]
MMKRIVLPLLIFCFSVFAESENIQCGYVPCQIKKAEAISFWWNRIAFSRISKEYVFGWYFEAIFDTYIRTDFDTESIESFRSIDHKFIHTITKSWSSPLELDEVKKSKDKKIILREPVAEWSQLYILSKEAKEIERFLKKVVSNHEILNADSLVRDFIKKRPSYTKKAMLLEEEFYEKIFQYFDSAKTLNGVSKKKFPPKMNTRDGLLVVNNELLKMAVLSSDSLDVDSLFRYVSMIPPNKGSSACIDYLMKLNSKFLFVKFGKDPLSCDDSKPWIAINKNSLTPEERTFLDNLVKVPLTPLNETGKLIIRKNL